MSTAPFQHVRSGGQTSRLDQIVAAALAIVDEGGLDALTMRRLAERLGAHLPTIYRVVKDKQSLIDEMAGTILSKALAGADVRRSARRDQARRLAVGLRSALLGQRDGARIVGGNYGATQSNLTYIDTLVGCMQSAGLDGEQALWAATALFCFVVGDVLEEQGATGVDFEALSHMVRSGRYPHLASSPVTRMLDFDARFEFGVDLILTAIARRSAGKGTK